MLTDIAFKASFLAMFFGTINAHPGRSTRPHDVVSEVIGKVTTILKSPKPVAPVVAKINGLTVSSNTSTAEANVTVSWGLFLSDLASWDFLDPPILLP